jgi:hypothetical protein
VLLAACRSSETAKEVKEDGKPHGAFTAALLAAVRQTRGSIDRRAHQYGDDRANPRRARRTRGGSRGAARSQARCGARQWRAWPARRLFHGKHGDAVEWPMVMASATITACSASASRTGASSNIPKTGYHLAIHGNSRGQKGNTRLASAAARSVWPRCCRDRRSGRRSPPAGKQDRMKGSVVFAA